MAKTLDVESRKLQDFLDDSGIGKHIEGFIEILEAREDILENHDLKKGEFEKKMIP